jgi:hypothetical protein
VALLAAGGVVRIRTSVWLSGETYAKEIGGTEFLGLPIPGNGVAHHERVRKMYKKKKAT